jgi:heterodisulfide reductase subunit A
VGSRDIQTAKNSYCSAVCCTYAIKEAMVAKEHSSVPLETAIFYMDIRTYGKDFERYYERAKEEHEVRFIRSRIQRIFQEENGDLLIRYADNDGVKEENFDLVVLSVGLRPSAVAKELAEKLGLELNTYGFCQVGDFSPVATSRPGVFAAGVFTGPRDIPETVMQASAAANEASCLLSQARGSLTVEKEYPPERDLRGEKPRIGVFVCHCGINIAGVIDVASVRDYACTLPDVAFVDDGLFACSQDTQQRIKEKMEEHNLNRLVVASCTPRTHEPLFQETLREIGLNKYLFEMANIRDQCSWVHTHEPEKATEKAKDLVRMAVAKARLIKPLEEMALGVNHAALVVGGGVSGMTAALNLAEQGFEVHLVEKAAELGGIASGVHQTLEGLDVQAFLKDLIHKVSQDPLIHIYKEASILEVNGYVGAFSTTVQVGHERETKVIEHGVAIIASGAEVYKPAEYFYGEHPSVLTMPELEEQIYREDSRVRSSQNVVMIQCVGSREEARPYCSRLCCSESIKCALELKEVNPEVNVYILYRDIRTYGFKEQYYQEARAKGVVFIPYDIDDKPEVEAISQNGEDILRISVNDPVLGERLSIDADVLALATATVPAPGREELAQFFKVPLNQDGFFLEAHVKLRPVDFPTEGVFICGLAHAPKLIDESIAQAKAAVARAVTILSKDRIEAGGTVSMVDKQKCSGCGVCEQVCPFNAIELDQKDKIAVVNEALCKGCGVCASTCRCGALNVKGFGDEQILAMIAAS